MIVDPPSLLFAMQTSKWHNLIVADGIVVEPPMPGQVVAFWMLTGREGKATDWERIVVMPQSEFAVDPGIYATAASVMRARQHVRGPLSRLWRRIRGEPTQQQSWVVPNGVVVEQLGQRQSDFVVVLSSRPAPELDDAWVKNKWPRSSRVQRLGVNLFLVAGVKSPEIGAGSVAAEPSECQLQWANQLHDAARQSGDPGRLAVALTDLGAVLLQQGDAALATVRLEDAIGLLKNLGDKTRLTDALDNLGLAALMQGLSYRAQDLFELALQEARQAGNRFAEKSILHHLRLAHATLGAPDQAISLFQQALAVAAQLGHRKHQAELHWLLAIRHAAQNQFDQAKGHGQSAVDLFRQMEHPEATWYAEILRRYRDGRSADDLLGSDEGLSAEAVKSYWNGAAQRSETYPYSMQSRDSKVPAVKPSVLQMALSATKAMAKFLGSGLKTMPPSGIQQRLRTCAACEHHTGIRCRLCGCFTRAKVRLPYEECPIGKWPALGADQKAEKAEKK